MQRDKSLKPQLVERISTLTHLRTLEISGHSERYYDPNLLGRLPDLEDLRIMMPDANFAEALVGILQTLDAKPMGGLRGLAIVCRVDLSYRYSLSLPFAELAIGR